MCKSTIIQKGKTGKKKTKKYLDAPRYKAISGYESEFKEQFKKELGLMTKEMVVVMMKMAPKK